MMTYNIIDNVDEEAVMLGLHGEMQCSASSSLLEASASGDVAEVKRWLKIFGDGKRKDDHCNEEDGEHEADEGLRGEDLRSLLQVDSHGYSAASWAACQDEEEILRLLLHSSEQFFHILTKGNAHSLLHLSCQHKAKRCLSLLLSFKASSSLLNAVNRFCETPLHLAAAVGDREGAEALLLAGANPLVRDVHGRSPYSVAKQNGYHSCASVIKKHLSPAQEVQLAAEERQLLEREEELSALSSEAPRQVLNGLKEHINSITLKSVEDPQEKHIFSKCPEPVEQPVAPPSTLSSCDASALQRVPLSKLVEYPGDYEKIQELLEQPQNIDFAGKDMFGLTALHKFASWNKRDLLALLVPHLTATELNMPGGPNGYSVLHFCVDMNAKQSLDYLVSLDRIDVDVVDKEGRTYVELAKSLENSILSD